MAYLPKTNHVGEALIGIPQLMMSNTFQDAYLTCIDYCIKYGIRRKSRLGDSFEFLSLVYCVHLPDTYEFEEAKLGRIDYKYANDFYDWMMSGNSEANEKMLSYGENVRKFLEKPKNTELPDNFNTFYGPRIVEQLPKILEELKSNENSRRAVISVLDSKDLQLLNKPKETLEYPCTDSMTLNVRDGFLYAHLHMRSQNMGIVAKLDMYLWGRLMCHIAKELDLKLGTFVSTIVSAHVYEKDVEFLTNQLKTLR